MKQAQQAKRDKYLNGLVNYKDIGILSRREFVERQIAAGLKPDIGKELNHNKTEALLERANRHPYRNFGNNQHPQYKEWCKLKDQADAGVYETYYTLGDGTSFWVISKTEYDYAISLQITTT